VRGNIITVFVVPIGLAMFAGTALAATSMPLIRTPVLSATLDSVNGDSAATQPTGRCISSGRVTLGRGYILQANEFRSVPFSVCPTGSHGFTVRTSAISTGRSGVLAYPSIYKGDHWNHVSPGDPFPIPISRLGSVSTSVRTVANAPGSWNDAYDTFFSSSGDSNPNQIEVMVWLTHHGQNHPAGHQVATNVNIGGHTWNVWHGLRTISYMSSQPVTSLSFNFGPIAQDLVRRGYVPARDALTDVEQGFEIWSGGQGLQTTSFRVSTLQSLAGRHPGNATPATADSANSPSAPPAPPPSEARSTSGKHPPPRSASPAAAQRDRCSRRVGWPMTRKRRA
jgi:hypothetical protein